MIRAGLIRGLTFGTLADGDGRTDPSVRECISAEFGIPPQWALINQVHGSNIAWASAAVHHGDADGIATDITQLPIVVATADCAPVAMEGLRSIGLVHAGWRGVAAGVVRTMVDTLTEHGDPPLRVSIGPHIGPCCFEVGGEVIAALSGFEDTTRWGTTSADLQAAIIEQVPDLDVETSDVCTRDDERFASFRRNGTPSRQVTVAWRP